MECIDSASRASIIIWIVSFASASVSCTTRLNWAKIPPLGQREYDHGRRKKAGTPKFFKKKKKARYSIAWHKVL